MVYIVMYNKGQIESVWSTRKEANMRREWIRSLKLRVSPYVQGMEFGECNLTIDIARDIQQKNIHKTIKSLKADVSW